LLGFVDASVLKDNCYTRKFLLYIIRNPILLQIPSGGWAGRFWPKINCNSAGDECEFGQSSPPCPAGGCHPPADTKVEFYFPSQPPKEDAWYDISLVDGYSLPMKIVPRGVNQVRFLRFLC
jgi:hypothetical protein